MVTARALTFGKGTGTGFDGGQETEDVLLAVRVADAVMEIVEEAVEIAMLFLDFVFGEPAGGGQVLGAVDGERRLMEVLVVVGEEELVEGPVRASTGGRLPGPVGAEGLAVGSGEDLGHGCGGGSGLVDGFDALGEGARERLRGDMAVVGESAGFGGGEGSGKNAVGDLGEDELDGGVVFEEGKHDFGALFRALGMAVVEVGVAMVRSDEGPGIALDSVDGERAALAFGRDGWRDEGGVGGVGGGGGRGHWHSFLWQGAGFAVVGNEKGRSVSGLFVDRNFPAIRVGNF